MAVERRPRRVTIAEVARLAGVSPTTVSVVLNGNADSLGISAATRATVVATSERLGYRPNRAAQALGRRRTDAVTLLVQDLANPWFIDLAVAARAAAEARGYRLNVVGAGPLEAELPALEALRDGSSDGVIVATGRHGGRESVVRTLRDLVASGLPAVMLIDRSPDPSVPAIRIDVEAGAHAATRHLIALGHRRIAHLALAGAVPLDQEQHAAGDRHRGYRRALAEAGIELDPARVVRGADTLAGGRAMVRELLSRPGPRPTAMLVYNDLTAMGVLRALHEAGVRVPADMAVVAHDGIEQGEYTIPALTTMRHPCVELGRLAVATIFDLLEGRAPAPLERTLAPTLLIRESCGAGS